MAYSIVLPVVCLFLDFSPSLHRSQIYIDGQHLHPFSELWSYQHTESQALSFCFPLPLLFSSYSIILPRNLTIGPSRSAVKWSKS
jgi:hypothetical protein